MILYKNVPGKKPITVENAMFTKDVYNHAKKRTLAILNMRMHGKMFFSRKRLKLDLIFTRLFFFRYIFFRTLIPEIFFH